MIRAASRLFIIFALVSACIPAAALDSDSQRLEQLKKMHAKAENFVALNEFRKAIEVYTEITLLEPDDVVAYTNLGHSHLLLGDYNRAENAFKNALHIEPENQLAWMGLRKIYDPDGTLILEDKEEQDNEAAQMMGLIPDKSKPAAAPVPSIDPPASISAPPSAPPVAPKAKETIKKMGSYSSSEPMPEKIQEALQTAGLYKGPIDGVLSEETVHAIRSFQDLLKMNVTGKVDAETWKALKLYLDE